MILWYKRMEQLYVAGLGKLRRVLLASCSMFFEDPQALVSPTLPWQLSGGKSQSFHPNMRLKHLTIAMSTYCTHHAPHLHELLKAVRPIPGKMAHRLSTQQLFQLLSITLNDVCQIAKQQTSAGRDSSIPVSELVAAGSFVLKHLITKQMRDFIELRLLGSKQQTVCACDIPNYVLKSGEIVTGHGIASFIAEVANPSAEVIYLRVSETECIPIQLSSTVLTYEREHELAFGSSSRCPRPP
jgi:hypothetical protein